MESQRVDLYIYSSGSVYAQKLLFAHTEYGDLTPLFSGYFDNPYWRQERTGILLQIAGQLGIPAVQILFYLIVKKNWMQQGRPVLKPSG